MNIELFRKAKSLMKEDLEEEYGENYGYVMELIKEEIARDGGEVHKTAGDLIKMVYDVYFEEISYCNPDEIAEELDIPMEEFEELLSTHWEEFEINVTKVNEP